jgi:hypothetical protein
MPKEIDGVTYLTQDEVDNVVKKRLERAENKFAEKLNKETSSVVEDYLSELGVDKDSLKELIKMNTPEHKQEIQTYKKMSEKAQKEAEAAKVAAEAAIAEKDNFLRKSAVSTALAGRVTQEQLEIAQEILFGRVTVKDGSVVGPEGEDVDKFVDSFLEKNSFLRAPKSSTNTPPPNGADPTKSRKEEKPVPFHDQVNLGDIFAPTD